MTEPTTRAEATAQAGADAAQTLGTQAFGTPGAAASEQDIAAQAGAGGGSGVTQADMDALYEYLKRMQVQLDAATRAGAAARGEEPVRVLVRAVTGFVKTHAEPGAVALAEDLGEASANLLDKGGTDTGPLSKITAKLARQLVRNPPHPGENWHYKQALAIAQDRLPDAIEDWTPPPAVPALGSDRPPAKVLSGNVTG